jgi:anti-sigma factor ChrR (cupin superfamily)
MDTEPNNCDWSEATCAYAVHALAENEIASVVAHNLACPRCRRELESLRPVVDYFVSWPTDILRPKASLQARLGGRIGYGRGEPPAQPPPHRWCEPDWEQIVEGIQCKLLAADTLNQRISMLVRFAPGASYAAHTHASNEACHLLDGELQIDEEHLRAGDFVIASAGSRHTIVQSAAGATCLVVTSTRDSLG